jgi:hypothetical protein
MALTTIAATRLKNHHIDGTVGRLGSAVQTVRSRQTWQLVLFAATSRTITLDVVFQSNNSPAVQAAIVPAHMDDPVDLYYSWLQNRPQTAERWRSLPSVAPRIATLSLVTKWLSKTQGKSMQNRGKT